MPKEAPPEQLGKYKILRRLAQGGMGEVLLGRITGADRFTRDVVIKRVLPQYTSDTAFMRMFRDEARITAQLRHGNIAQVIEFAEEDGQFFLVLEYINGPSVGDILGRLNRAGKTLSVAECAHVIAETARALDYAHHKRGEDGARLLLVHRDVSPSNILVSREGDVKLTDFGIARARARLSPVTGAAGLVKGKIAYMPPEALEGKAEPRSDTFALGAVAFELFTGAPPFAGETEMETIHNILLGDTPKLSSIVPELPEEIETLIGRMLAKSPEARPTRGFEVAQALTPFTLAEGKPPHELLADTIAELFPPTRRPDSEGPTAVQAPLKRVLVVDESRTMRMLVKAKLAKSYVVIEASSTDEALETMADAAPAAVVCQQMLSQMSGLNFCRMLKQDERFGEIPVLLLASGVTDSLRSDADEAGVSAVIPKKLTGSELQDALDKLTRH